MAESIYKIDKNLMAQIMGPDAISVPSNSAGAVGDVNVGQSTSPFDMILNKAVDSLESVSKVESQTNALINSYIAGKADLSDVMIATAKMNIAVQLAVTTVTSTVNTFKEITQIQI